MNNRQEPIIVFENDTIDSAMLGEDNFDTLSQKILEDNGSDDPKNILSLIIKGREQLIRANNYVGTICFKDGTSLEILPKIGKADNSIEKSKLIFEKMLSVALELPFKTYEKTKLDRIDGNPFEFFIKLFVQYTFNLLEGGLASSYYDVQGNESFLRGRINFSQNIRYNYAHDERLFVEYQKFGENTPANRLIKTTVEYLSCVSSNSRNRMDLNIIRSEMDSVPISPDIDADFSKVVYDRNMDSYPVILKICDLFLRNNSLSSFHGDNITVSFLFPMERLYEAYVSDYLFKKYHVDYSVNIQSGGGYLFKLPNKRFFLRPDVIIRSRKDPNEVFIVDTKWKLVSNEKDLSQSDIYQMFAYSKHFKSKKTILLYPGEKQIEWSYNTDDVHIQTKFVDLSDILSLDLNL